MVETAISVFWLIILFLRDFSLQNWNLVNLDVVGILEIEMNRSEVLNVVKAMS